MRATPSKRSSKVTERPVSVSSGSGDPALDVGHRGASLISPTVLLAACGDDAEGLEILCQVFRAHAPLLVAEADDALRERDGPQLRRAAHKLCGILMAFSSVAASVAMAIEDHAAHGRLDEVPPLVQRLEMLTRELHHQLDGQSVESLKSQREAGEPSSGRPRKERGYLG